MGSVGLLPDPTIASKWALALLMAAALGFGLLHRAFGGGGSPKQPVDKVSRPSSPGGGATGDPQFSRWGPRLNHSASLRSAFAFRSKYTRASSPGGGLLPHAPCQPGASPLAALTPLYPQGC